MAGCRSRQRPGAAWELNTTGGHLTVGHFLRYIRWLTTGTVSGNPVVQIDIIAKSCG